ncbi:hypothetical protein [Microbacterium sp. 1P06AB]|uniref:hypothetical protein n=1 Tax=Microbacterium sp. 1P06AB TaxID=3132289 RepID=UPI0039A60358
MPQAATVTTVAEHLHVSRMSTYAAAADGDLKRALDLYLWNARISAAVFETLSVTEVILRNAIDAALKNWNVTRGDYPAEWTSSAAAPLNSLISGALPPARSNAGKARAKRAPDHPRKTAEITHDDVVAQLTFGTYAKLMPCSDESDDTFVRRQILWDEALKDSFRGRPGDDYRVHAGRVERLHALRNRVAHAEPVLSVNFRSRMKDMARLIDSINPELTGWLSGTTRIHDVLRERPGT